MPNTEALIDTESKSSVRCSLVAGEVPGLSRAVVKGFAGRCVEFVARPGCTEKLRQLVHDVVMPALALDDRFEGCIVMVSEHEPRLVSVLCFWSTAPTPKGYHWEEIPSIKVLLAPLVDARRGARMLRTSMSFANHFSSLEGVGDATTREMKLR